LPDTAKVRKLQKYMSKALPRKILVFVFSILSVSLAEAALSGCGELCGNWQLNASASDKLAPILDAAFQRYKVPRQKLRRSTNTRDIDAMSRDALDEALGPRLQRPEGDELRADLTKILTSPLTLSFGTKASDLVIAAGEHNSRRLTPGEPHTRVDTEGTARIRSEWLQGHLVITEKYDRSRNSRDTYLIQPRDGSLLITRSIVRPGLPVITVRSVYHRA
jgi:hypothetical protein